MKNLDIISKISREKLDKNDYLNSLIDEALYQKLINEEKVANIKIQLLEILDETINRYNGLESSSVRKEIFEQIYNSVVYTIGLYLKTYRNPDDAIDYLLKNNIKDAYKKGKKIINRKLDIIRVYYIKTINNKVITDNITYNQTIIDGIKGFLKIYDPDYNAQDYKITADYPLFNNLIGKLSGVEFIERYVKSINIENSFCNLFDKKKINILLMTYSNDYKDLIINIFEIVLFEVIACKLVNRNVADLIITRTELKKIYINFEDKSETEINNIIINTLKDIKNEKNINEENYEYITKNKIYICNIINKLYKLNRLDKIFITEKYLIK